MLTSEKIARHEAIVEYLEDQVKMLSDPDIKIDPLSYIKMQLHIERRNLEKAQDR
jgi:hypothetical protein